MDRIEREVVIRVVTMIGGIDVIGEILETPHDIGWERLWHPFQLMPNQQGLALRPMLGEPRDNKFVITGDFLTIAMRNVMWINPPSDHLKKAYMAARSGLVLPFAVNQ